MLVDHRNVSAPVGTAADYSIISGKLESILKKAVMPWTGTQVLTDGRHVVAPLGVCTEIPRSSLAPLFGVNFPGIWCHH